MNTNVSDPAIRPEDESELESGDDLAEVGRVTETKGGPLGFSLDNGGGYQRF